MSVVMFTSAGLSVRMSVQRSVVSGRAQRTVQQAQLMSVITRTSKATTAHTTEQ